MSNGKTEEQQKKRNEIRKKEGINTEKSKCVRVCLAKSKHRLSVAKGTNLWESRSSNIYATATVATKKWLQVFINCK